MWGAKQREKKGKILPSRQLDLHSVFQLWQEEKFFITSILTSIKWDLSPGSRVGGGGGHFSEVAPFGQGWLPDFGILQAVSCQGT